LKDNCKTNKHDLIFNISALANFSTTKNLLKYGIVMGEQRVSEFLPNSAGLSEPYYHFITDTDTTNINTTTNQPE
jgi:hypothetical protein